MAKEISKSSSNLQEITFSGRPRGEEPHVIRKVKRKVEHVEYIVRVDLDELKIDDDQFDDLQSLYQLYDFDTDGILNFKEFEKLLRCLGYRLTEEAAQTLAATVSVDITNFSVSFNEFLEFMSKEQNQEPDEETMVGMFTSFDKQNKGKIPEQVFKKIMQGKDDVDESDMEEMLEEYYRMAKLKGITSGPPPESPSEEKLAQQRTKKEKRAEKLRKLETADEKYIDYKEFAAMLQQ